MNEDWLCAGCNVIHPASFVPYLGLAEDGTRDLFCSKTFRLRVKRESENVA